LIVRRNQKVALAGKGQVNLGEVATKGNARKARRIYNDSDFVCFVGATADVFFCWQISKLN
jgi:ATP-dependent HslUV protease, peptidase subunit HslV